MELFDFEEEELSNAPIDIDDDDDDYDNTDLLCEGDDKVHYDLCSGCDANPFAHLVQPCGLMIYTICVKKNSRELCGLYKLGLSGANRGHWEWVCDLGRSKGCSRGLIAEAFTMTVDEQEDSSDWKSTVIFLKYGY